MDIPEHELHGGCDCPTSCNYLLFDPAVSYGSTSSYAKDRLLTAAHTQDLTTRFIDARETTERMNKDKYERFRSRITEAADAYTALHMLMTVGIRDRLLAHLANISALLLKMNTILARKEFIYKYQEYSIQKNFMRARDAMEERTLSVLCSGFHEHVFDTEFTLKEIVKAQSANDSALAKSLYTQLTRTLQSKIETAGRAFSNYTQLYKAYRKGKKIFNYKFKNESRDDNWAIIPKPLLNESLTHNYYARRYSPRVGKDIKRVMNVTEAFQTMAKEVHENVTLGNDELHMHELSGEFLDACEDYFHSKSTFYFETIDRPLRIIQERIGDFELLKNHYVSNLDVLRATIDNMTVSLRAMEENVLHEIYQSIQKAVHYIDDMDITKTDLGREFSTVTLNWNLHSAGLFFTEQRNRGQFIYDMWRQVQTDVLKIWDTIVNDKDAIEYYRHKQLDDFLQPFDKIEQEVTQRLAFVRDYNDIRYVIGNKDNLFFEAVDALRADLELFQEGNKMDDKFIRDNFLQLDVYYRELRHEQIDQQKAYDVIALLCDIGGSMGLFIGASALTVFEIVDFLVNQGVMAANRKVKDRRKHVTNHV